MSVKSRVETLEKQSGIGSGFYVVFGKHDDSEEKDIQDYCKEHDIDRDKSILIWMSPRDQRTL